MKRLQRAGTASSSHSKYVIPLMAAALAGSLNPFTCSVRVCPGCSRERESERYQETASRCSQIDVGHKHTECYGMRRGLWRAGFPQSEEKYEKGLVGGEAASPRQLEEFSPNPNQPSSQHGCVVVEALSHGCRQ